MAERPAEQITFEGEEADTGYASPALDLVAAGALIALSVAVMVASYALPLPGNIRTAPGLLPFLVAFSLLIMSLGLGASALARRRASVHLSLFSDRDMSTDIRSLLLACAVAVYIAALQILAFQQNFTILGANLRLTAFEPVTVIALTTIIHLCWRGPIWITLCVTIAWAAILSLIFQLVFRIPLPGTF